MQKVFIETQQLAEANNSYLWNNKISSDFLRPHRTHQPKYVVIQKFLNSGN